MPCLADESVDLLLVFHLKEMHKLVVVKDEAGPGGRPFGHYHTIPGGAMARWVGRGYLVSDPLKFGEYYTVDQKGAVSPRKRVRFYRTPKGKRDIAKGIHPASGELVRRRTKGHESQATRPIADFLDLNSERAIRPS